MTDLPSISQTAQYMAFFRAIETERRHDRLFADPFARLFLSRSLKLAAASAKIPAVGRLIERYIDARWPGAWSAAVARTKLIDDWVAAAVTGAEQVVILGAGFDCRSLRLKAMTDLPVFEVDQHALLKEKQRVLAASAQSLRRGLTYVPVDFLVDDIASRLREAGFCQDARTLFLWEGVTNYLDAQAVDKVFKVVANIGGRTSRLVFTYIHADVLSGRFAAPGLAALQRRLARSGEAWTFGMQPTDVPSILAKSGLRLVSDLGAAEYRSSTMRSRAEGLAGYEFYRVAEAEILSE